jgi:copper oxidase (laccase) domain-containing protein
MSGQTTWKEFDALKGLQGFRHRFTLREPGIDVAVEREEVLARLRGVHGEHVAALGFDSAALVTAEQIHGNRVAVVDASTVGGYVFAAADGLVCQTRGRVLGIYVADCCAIYLVDEDAGSFGLLHSGKRGSESNIVGEAIGLMVGEHGADPGRMRVLLSPCIRPPAYEVDFAALIRADALAAGVKPEHFHDEGICTSSDLKSYYSYRMEKGRTGRMLALLGRM